MDDHSSRLWNYALVLYARRHVADACLALQDDHGLDVCELLWVCWLASRGMAPAEDAGRALEGVRGWQREVTRPLRAQRRALKPLARDRPDIARLRQTIKEAELLAEREALNRLQALAEAGLGVRQALPGDTLIASLRHLVAARHHETDEALACLARAAGAEPGPPC
ncbi:TIGR02444 family protein [Modicisalibacter ilicicola]|uniref:TIGR02444 family protein n=1 Tax=Modicisalibacter ilicicola TaxID=480814 RepID=UPI0009FD4E9C|nr:TIGR02444 family protein [Halomonas ilicicola]